MQRMEMWTSRDLQIVWTIQGEKWEVCIGRCGRSWTRESLKDLSRGIIGSDLCSGMIPMVGCREGERERQRPIKEDYGEPGMLKVRTQIKGIDSSHNSCRSFRGNLWIEPKPW